MKILIAVITCKAYAYKLKVQQATWIPQALALGWDVQVFDGERLGAPDDYAGLPAKTKALCGWALANGYTNILKIDDDAYVWVHKFKMLDFDYAGHEAAANDQGCPKLGVPNYPKGHFPYKYASGGAYWLSEKSMKILVNTEINDWAEDRWVGNTLARNGVHLTHLGDYGCNPTPPVLNKNFTLLAQIPDGGIEKIAKGMEPSYPSPLPPVGTKPNGSSRGRAGARPTINPPPPPFQVQKKLPTPGPTGRRVFGRPPNPGKRRP
jgi:hypothetical protein